MHSSRRTELIFPAAVGLSSTLPLLKYNVRVGGDPPAIQESAFQWIENLAMSALVICTNPLAREVMHLLQLGRVLDTEGGVHDTTNAEGDRDTLHAEVTPTLQLVGVEERVLGKRLSMMGCRVPDVCAKCTGASGLLKR